MACPACSGADLMDAQLALTAAPDQGTEIRLKVEIG